MSTPTKTIQTENFLQMLRDKVCKNCPKKRLAYALRAKDCLNSCADDENEELLGWMVKFH